MKKIINEKLYNTEKSNLIVEFREKVEHTNILGQKYYPYHFAKLYKTAKGQYFKYIGKECNGYDNNYEKIILMSDGEAKELLIELNDVDNYIKEFGEVEEG